MAPIIGTQKVSYIKAGIDLLKAVTGADNVWRNDTAQAWATHTGGDLTARGNTQRGLANASSLLADASRASIAEHKAQWWQTAPPNYLQWNIDMPSFPWLCLGTHCQEALPPSTWERLLAGFVLYN